VFERSAATRAVIDGDYPAVERTVDDLGYETVSETWVRETAGVSLGLVARLADALTTVEAGLRFGDPATQADRDAPFETVTPDPELLATLHGVDAERTRTAVAADALAFETADAGARVTGSVAVPPGAYKDLLEAFCGLLSEHFEAVERATGEIRVTERTFDPTRARELGVPEGPAFGKLASGESVEVDCRTVDPEEVHTRERTAYRTSV
jgi:D-aminoacyl-tRNA deacylase